jgi:ectoine hydroxylase-related dioxygenase (phytanoyl-CoA dioxygenase family)
MTLSAGQIAQFREEGFLAVEGVFSAERVTALRQRMEELVRELDNPATRRSGVAFSREGDAAPQPGLRGAAADAAVRTFGALTRHEPVFRAAACSPALVDLVVDLVGTPLSLYSDQAMLKPPRYGTEKPPHQDNAYFRIDPADAGVTAWCALDDATVENGCMQYVAGSHRLGLVEHEAIAGTPHLIPRSAEASYALAPVPAGSVVFHHLLTMHRSGANHSDTWRRAFICHFVRSDARMPGRRPDAAPLLTVR